MTAVAVFPELPAAEKTAGAPLLSVSDCHVRYGLVPALRGVSLEVMPGEMVALLGANGAGKTTTLRAISGMIGTQSGTISFDGRRIDGKRPYDVVGLGIAHMPEGRELFPQLTVTENLRYGYWPRRKDRKSYAAELDKVFELFPRMAERRNQAAGTLSGGEQQMLTAGMALMSKPRLLLVDELSLGLAPLVVGQLFDALNTVNQATGTAILLVEQFVPLALANTSRAYVLSKGEVVMSRPSAELKDDPELVTTYLGGGAVHATPAPPAKEPPASRTRGRRAPRGSRAQ